MVLNPKNFILAAAVLVASCETVPVDVVQTTGERVTSTSGARPASSIPSSAQASFSEVIARVEPVAEQMCRERSPQRNCDFRIVVDDRPGVPPNAFQTLDQNNRPIIGFTAALLRDARNVDEMAFILSHEAAHHIEGHLEQQRANAATGAEAYGRLAGAAGSRSAEDIAAAEQLGALVGSRTFSQNFELEADALGTRIAARAGYNPVRGAQFFFRIPDPGDRFLGTHPANADRVATVRNTAAELGL